jgi:protoheme IX farnesyltransferase
VTQLTGQTQALSGVVLRPAWARAVADLCLMLKPRITLLVAIITAIGFLMASRTIDGPGRAAALLWTVLGAALSCMAAGVFNQAIERRSDALMRRTADRPVAAGRVSPGAAHALGWGLALAGVGLVWAGGNALAAGVDAFTIASYACLYTPLKRVTSFSLLVGAVPGALPPVIGYAAAAGRLDAPIAVMFAIMFLWQVPHFLAIAWLHREDYARGGFPMLSVVDPTGVSVFRHMLLSCVALLPLGLLPASMGMAGPWYFAGALGAGLLFLVCAIELSLRRSRASARATFLASLVYLPVVFALVVIDGR